MVSLNSTSSFSQFIFIGLLGGILMLNACNTPGESQENNVVPLAIETQKLDMTLMREFLSQLCESTDSALKIDDNIYTNLPDFKRAYGIHNFEAYWLNEGGVKKQASDYLQLLNEIEFDGLDKNKYLSMQLDSLYTLVKAGNCTNDDLQALEASLSYSFISLSQDMVLGRDTSLRNKKHWKIKNDSNFNFATNLHDAIANNNVIESFEKLRPAHNYYQAFRKEYKRLSQISIVWPKVHTRMDSIRIGDSLPEIQVLRKRLFLELGSPIDTNSFYWQDDLLAALKKFQYLNHVKIHGKLDSSTLSKINISIGEKLKKLSMNMERLRWMQLNFQQPYVWVVVPKMELDYVDQDSNQFHMKVVVGRASRPTPTLVSKLQHIVFSPPWTVPPTIMKEEVIPGIARRGGSYLRRRGLKAYDRKGRVVSAANITSKNYRNYSIGQAPGYRSSLGEVKFNMPNPWSIYLHDTPHREDFVKSNRALSSGCVRVHHPKEFAEFLLQDTTKYSFALIDSICKTRKTKYIPFKRDLDVYIVYLTNALDSTGNMMYLKDIYKWD